MPPVAEDTFSVVVTEHWLDEFCEQVGSLFSVLQALSRIQGNDRPHTLVSEALDNCATLQDLLNAIPVAGGHIPSLLQPAPMIRRPVATHNAQQEDAEESEWGVLEPSSLGDSFPHVQESIPDQLPAVDLEELHSRYADGAFVAQLLDKFRARAEGDLRELELLSVGHDWTRLSRLAGVLKTSAAQVSAARIVVDAAALQGAARVGCRNDVDLALDALRADLRACAHQINDWMSDSVVG